MKQMSDKNKTATIEIMNRALLFSGLEYNELAEILNDNSTRVCRYRKGQVIFEENSTPKCVYILLSGCVGIVRSTNAGKRILLHQIEMSGEIFGEVYLFMQKKNYEIQAEAITDTVLMELTNSIFLQTHDGQLTRIEEKLRKNMLTIFAGKAYQMNRKVKILGCSSIREKIANYLIDRQSPGKSEIQVPGREEMADYMNVARPSLSRELVNMRDEGIIDLARGKITIINQENLESYL